MEEMEKLLRDELEHAPRKIVPDEADLKWWNDSVCAYFAAQQQHIDTPVSVQQLRIVVSPRFNLDNCLNRWLCETRSLTHTFLFQPLNEMTRATWLAYEWYIEFTNGKCSPGHGSMRISTIARLIMQCTS
jgi:hypothetical protein